jgi:hypothetical protein
MHLRILGKEHTPTWVGRGREGAVLGLKLPVRGPTSLSPSLIKSVRVSNLFGILLWLGMVSKEILSSAEEASQRLQSSSISRLMAIRI